MKNKGWRNNSHNHKMASKGVKTKLDKFAINNILYNSSDPYLSNLKIKYAYKLDKNKYLLVATSLNPEDSNLRLYDIYEVKKHDNKFKFNHIDTKYGMEALNGWLNRRGL